MYLSQFRLRVFHRSEKSNVIFDAFFRLSIKRQNVVDQSIDNLNIDVFNENVVEKTLIEMSNEFRRKLIKKYDENLS